MTSTQEQRIEALKAILLQLHQGTPPEEVQETFNHHFTGVSALEISLMEHQLMNSDTGITFEDVMKLCNVHANLFKSSINDVSGTHSDISGHPVRVFKDENLALQAALIRIQRLLDTLLEMPSNDIEPGLVKGFQHQVSLLGQFDNHYTRKEKLFFPHMERHGHVAPPKVMWGVDDEIRDLYHHFAKLSATLPTCDIAELQEAFTHFEHEFKEMIFKEESILLNILLEILTEDNWLQIATESDIYGYAMISKPDPWIPIRHDFAAVDIPSHSNNDNSVKLENTDTIIASSADNQYIKVAGGYVKVDFIPNQESTSSDSIISRDQAISFTNSGNLSLNQIELIMNHLPLEVTFVNKDNIFQYFNQVTAYESMIFPRTPSQIGRDLELCHPPKVWDKVSTLINDLKTGQRDKESMWFKKADQFIYVTYTAIRDDNQEFQGILETVQDIQPFLDLASNQKRNLSERPKE